MFYFLPVKFSMPWKMPTTSPKMKSNRFIGSTAWQKRMKWNPNGSPLNHLFFSIALMIFLAVGSGFRIGKKRDFTPLNMPVFIKYGATVLTFTLLFACLSSMRSESDHPVTAHLLAAYTDMRGFEIIPAADAILHTWPKFLFSISGRNASVTSIGAVALMFIVRVMSLTLCSANVLLFATMPAQLIIMSMPPLFLLAIFAASCTCSAFDTSTFWVKTLPSGVYSALAFAMLSSLISQMVRLCAPFSRTMRPIIFPMPEPPPVISTLVALIFVIVLYVLVRS